MNENLTQVLNNLDKLSNDELKILYLKVHNFYYKKFYTNESSIHIPQTVDNQLFNYIRYYFKEDETLPLTEELKNAIYQDPLFKEFMAFLGSKDDKCEIAGIFWWGQSLCLRRTNSCDLNILPFITEETYSKLKSHFIKSDRKVGVYLPEEFSEVI